MAKGRKTGGRDFKKGQSGNPLGGQLLNRDLIIVRRMTHQELADMGDILLQKSGTLEHLEELITSPETSYVKKIFASVALRAIRSGDYHAMEALLNRIIGRVKEKIEITTDQKQPETNKPNFEKLSIQELEHLDAIMTKAKMENEH